MTLAFVGKVFDGHEILGLGTVVVEGGEISRISGGGTSLQELNYSREISSCQE